MGYFLGFIPDKESINKIKQVIEEVSILFDDFGIPVRWSKPNSFHITLIYLGESMFFLYRMYLMYKLKNVCFRGFNIRFNTIKLGISKQQRGLIYLDLLEGGDELRDMFFSIEKKIKIANMSTFLPHLTIGRVNKDLSDEEYRNLVKDIQNVSKNMKIKDIQFFVNDISLIKGDINGNTVLKKF